jgi:hypothetical protein
MHHKHPGNIGLDPKSLELVLLPLRQQVIDGVPQLIMISVAIGGDCLPCSVSYCILVSGPEGWTLVTAEHVRSADDLHDCLVLFSGFVGLFEWVIMTFGLKNASATYQRAMNLIFLDLLRVLMEVYNDDVVVKSVGFEGHMTVLKLSLERMKKYRPRMNPLKCAFGCNIRKVLGVYSTQTRHTNRPQEN